MYRRIVWHYTDDENAEKPIAVTAWGDDYSFGVERLHSAGFEGVGRWHAGEALEESLGLSSGDGYYGRSLEVEYIDAYAARPGQIATFTVEESETGPDDEDE